MTFAQSRSANPPRGGTVLGFIAGLVVGLAIALALAVYITKVPIPFMNKGLSRTADQDAAEDRKNKDWDPNALLYGKNPAKSGEKEGEDADAAKPAAKTEPRASTDPLGDLARAKTEAKPEPKPVEAKPAEAKPSEKPAEEPFIYFVQAGAYRTPDEAEGQRAKLVMQGFDARISERDQGGRIVYRVRMGPLQTKAEADKLRERLESAHIESALVRVQR